MNVFVKFWRKWMVVGVNKIVEYYNGVEFVVCVVGFLCWGWDVIDEKCVYDRWCVIVLCRGRGYGVLCWDVSVCGYGWVKINNWS